MRCAVRWLQLFAGETPVAQFSASDLFTFSLRQHSIEQLAAARHQEELEVAGNTELCIDYRHAGTGNTSLKGERLPDYQVPLGKYSWLLEMALL
jgi:hypothetical protein